MTTVLVTRPRESFSAALEVVRSLGFEAVGAPMAELVPRRPEEFQGLRDELTRGRADLVVFTSANGVKFANDCWPGLSDALRGVEVAAIGPSTALALERLGLKPRVPRLHSSLGLADELAQASRGKRVFLLRSGQGSPALSDGLRAAGATVVDVPIYDVVLPRDLTEQRAVARRVALVGCDVFTFTSTMVFENFLRVADLEGVTREVYEEMRRGLVAAIGEPTASAARSRGLDVRAVPESASFVDLMTKVNQEITLGSDSR